LYSIKWKNHLWIQFKTYDNQFIMKTVIRVENIAKLYRLGEIGTGTISHDLNRWWARVRGKEDPYSTIGAINGRTSKTAGDYVWALQDINFEVKQGEVLGIIGRNGAGKSTLLKILSKVTKPSTGRIFTKGRIASLLEVGTGFHAEMTGRENIFLNGAIMGMTKLEIKHKLDEIIDFAGVEKYIDTPVKRYSSGMYVRLAFAVAAHLNAEILVVDEVLAVGDAEFQKKCLGKMGDINRTEGKTVLFVSHNMATIQNLCNTGLYLKSGQKVFHDNANEAISFYLNDIKINTTIQIDKVTSRIGSGLVKMWNILAFDKSGSPSTVFKCGEQMLIKIYYTNHTLKNIVGSRIDIGINNEFDIRVAWLSTAMFTHKLNIHSDHVSFSIKKIPLTGGIYNVNLYCETDGEISDWIQNVFSFEIAESDFYNTGKTIPQGQGHIYLDYEIL
jgi:lipopolysaccharide transport system ATP-binding protein